MEVRQEDVAYKPFQVSWIPLEFSSQFLQYINQVACPISLTPLQERFYSNLFVIPSLEWKIFLQSDIVQEMPFDVRNQLTLSRNFKKNISSEEVFATIWSNDSSQLESLDLGQIRLNVNHNFQDNSISVMIRGPVLLQTLPKGCIYTKQFRKHFSEIFQDIQLNLITQNHERNLISIDSLTSMNILRRGSPCLNSPVIQFAILIFLSLCALSHVRKFISLIRHS
jgi:hypothetical protein